MQGDVHRPASGVASYDEVIMSAPPPQIPEACELGDGLAFVVQPSMPWVQDVQVPPQAVDVAIWMNQGVRLETSPAHEMKTRQLHRHSLLILPAGMPTRWTAEDGMPEALHLHIDPSFRRRWCDDAGVRDRSLEPATNLNLRQAGAGLQRARLALSGKSPFRRLLAQVAALEVAETCITARLGSRASSGNSMTPARLRRVRAYVEEHIAEDLCIENMAACVGLSASHFSRAFKAEMGMSPYAWVLQTRLERAKDQLLNSRKPLAQIAMDCGFASQSHLTETFRRVVGVPPARWRKEAGGEPFPSRSTP